MRQVKMVTLLVSIFVLIMQCSTNESLDVFQGRLESVVTIDTQYTSYAPYTFHLYADTVKWVFEFLSGGGTRVNIIFSGHDSTFTGRSLDRGITTSPGTPVDIRQNYLDLAVETYTGSTPGIVHIAFDTIGGFLDTVPIAVFQTSGVVPPVSSRLFVNMIQLTPDPDTSLHTFDTIQFMFDTIQLADPHAVGGQQ